MQAIYLGYDFKVTPKEPATEIRVQKKAIPKKGIAVVQLILTGYY
jgi:hypothetical protein